MCRAARSAHGSISTALNAEAFPHDFADSPTTGSSRMCNTARARTNTEPFSPDHRRCSGAGTAPRSATAMTGPGVPGPLGEPRGRAPGGRFRGPDRPIAVPAAAVARPATPFPGPATALPEGSAVVQVVQICHKGPDCVGAPEKNRWYSALSSAADPAVGHLCGRFGHAPPRTAPGVPPAPPRAQPSRTAALIAAGSRGSGVRYRAGRDGAAHSTGTRYRRIRGIMRKRLGVQRR